MQSGRATFDGEVTNRLINFYTKRSSNLGLPIVEHAYISLTGKLSPKQLGIYADSMVPGFEKLATAIHETGAPAVLQITHAGVAASRRITGSQPAGPSAGGKARALEKEELVTIVNDFAVAAERALKAGFDGVELHGAHGYLLNQFLTPLLNKREDEYGGSPENRIRFPLMVVEQVRKVLGGSKLLLYRMGSDDLTAKGTQMADAVNFGVELEKAGIDILDISGGMCGSEPHQLKGVKGYFVPQAREIRKAVHVPVIGVGGIKDPLFADKLVRDEMVDLVAVGRVLLKEPDWVDRAIQRLAVSSA
jgi:2,4-dienoyl-CoA reductase-like NADH-dependent reductase (Old Yellow Enzyme family)